MTAGSRLAGLLAAGLSLCLSCLLLDGGGRRLGLPQLGVFLMKVMPGVFTSGASLVMARLRVFTSGFSPSTLTFSSGTGVSLSLQVNHDTPGSRQIGRSRPLQGTCSCSSCLPLVAGAPAAPGGQVAGAGAALHVTVAGPHLCPGQTQGCARGRGASAGTGRHN